MLQELYNLNYDIVGPEVVIGNFRLRGVSVVSLALDDYSGKILKSWETYIDYNVYLFHHHRHKNVKTFINDGRNGGSVLTSRPCGYYKRLRTSNNMYTVERLVIGCGGEVYFTGNHYQSFVQVHVDNNNGS